MPVVDDGDGDLGGLRVIGVPDVAGDAHAAPAGLIQRTERLVVVVVDVGWDRAPKRSAASGTGGPLPVQPALQRITGLLAVGRRLGGMDQPPAGGQPPPTSRCA